MPSSACSGTHSDPHSFPTRRSSDLLAQMHRVLPGGCQGGRPSGFARNKAVCRRTRPRRAPDGDSGRTAPTKYRASRNRKHNHAQPGRSEEHTSELQSPYDLVCRLLLAPAPTPIHTLSLHDALPISLRKCIAFFLAAAREAGLQVSQEIKPFAGARGRAARRTATPAALHQQSTEQAETASTTTRSQEDRKSTRLNSSHRTISYAVFCLLRHPLRSTLFPYTTLFRSPCANASRSSWRLPGRQAFRFRKK